DSVRKIAGAVAHADPPRDAILHTLRGRVYDAVVIAHPADSSASGAGGMRACGRLRCLYTRRSDTEIAQDRSGNENRSVGAYKHHAKNHRRHEAVDRMAAKQ